MHKFIRDILTLADNETFDIIRVGMASAFVFLFLMEIVKLIITHSFSEMEFAGGFCSIAGVGAGSLAIKHKTELRGDEDAK